MGLFLLTYRNLADDGYITLAFAENLGLRGQWAVTPGLLSNTATSSLWVLILGALTAVTRSAMVALGIGMAASFAVLSAALTATARQGRWSWVAGPVTAAVVALCPLTAATVGLESCLVIALLAVLVHTVVGGRLAATGVVCGLLVLARPDAGVFAVAAVVALLAARRPDRPAAVARILLVPAAVAVTVCLPWLVTSVWLFGSPIPDTLAWKTAQSLGLGGRFYGDAVPLFADRYPAATALTVGLVVLGGIAAVLWAVFATLHPAFLLLAAGAGMHWLVMDAMTVPPFPWYYAPVVASAAMLLVLGAASLPGPSRMVAALLPAAAVAGGVVYAVGHDYAGHSVPFHANYATGPQYAGIVAQIPDGAVVETAHGEIGAIAFYCSTRCRAVDPLSDPGRLAPVITAALAQPGERGAVLRELYRWWEPTDAVRADLQTVSTGPGGPGTPIYSGFGGNGHLQVVPASP